MAVVAIAEGAVTHGRVANQEEYGVGAASAAAWFWAGGLHDVEAVASAVVHSVDVRRRHHINLCADGARYPYKNRSKNVMSHV